MVFLGSKPIGFRCLQYALTQQQTLGFQIVAVGTRQRLEFTGESNLYELAEQHNIPVISKTDEIPPCDWIYSVQYHEILKKHHLEQATQLAVNLHLAPLPEYRGSNQFSFAILDGATEFGVTIHEMNTGIDSGDILFEKRFPIKEDTWVQELYDESVQAAEMLFQSTLANLVQGRFTRIPQLARMRSYPSSLHYRHEINTIKKIDLSWPEERIHRHVRATSMAGFEPPFAEIGGKRVYLTQTYS